MGDSTKVRAAKPAIVSLLVCLALTLLGACAGPTSVEPLSSNAPFAVSMRLDPPTLNPPQLGTLTYSIVDTTTGRPVTRFESVADALLHNVVVTSDLLYFRHSFTRQLVVNDASVLTYFPTTGSYLVYALFKPQGAPVQQHKATITTGQATHGAELIEEPTNVKQSGSLRIQFFSAPSPIRAHQPAQLAFRVTERGRPVPGLWPHLGAAGHLWILDAEGEHLAHVAGTGAQRVLMPEDEATGTRTPGAEGTPARERTPAGRTPTATPSPFVTQVPPTLAPEIAGALGTAEATTPFALAPVQETAQASILGTPAVQPQIGYGPDVLFTHTFAEPGMYKMWLEVLYRGMVTTVDYVVRVAE